MKVLVLGSNGMLGHGVALYLLTHGHNVEGVAKEDNPFIPTRLCDLRNRVPLTQWIETENYDFIINCAALLVGESDQQKADSIYINSYLPHYIADYIRNTPTRLIQISTDSVFPAAGKELYSDTDRKICERFYDRTKDLGEIEDEKNITLRASVIGLESRNEQKSLMNWFLNQKTTVEGYDNVIWCGLTNIAYARIIEKILYTNHCGILQVSNNSGISKGDLLRLCNSHLRPKKIMINENKSVTSHRVLRCSDRLEGFSIPSYETMIKEIGIWVRRNISYYEYFYGEELYEILELGGRDNE